MIFSLLIPLLFLAAFIYAAIKRVNVYDSFVEGIKKAPPLLLSIFPYIAATLIMIEIFDASGLTDLFTKLLSPVFSLLGIPEEIIKLVLLKPFSGSGSTALLNEIITAYGADSYISRCACCCYGSSETIFYVGAVYFSSCRKKNLALPIIISLFSSLLSVVFACFICRFI